MVGLLRSVVTSTPLIRGGIETTLLGGGAALLSYVVGNLLSFLVA